ncbi:MAG TPA: DALR domain-containing protein, partial [Azospirillaceae bacterium]|nr:DALR domain-containing protein [Azospirillaceae bacterium]
LDFTKELLKQQKQALDRWYTALRHAADVAANRSDLPFEMLAALEDDLNTPMAISHLHELASTLNKAATPQEKAKAKGALLAAGEALGILLQDPETWFKWQPEDAGALTESEIADLIAQRQAARKAKNFAEADRLRKELSDNGVILEDGPQGTTWKRG